MKGWPIRRGGGQGRQQGAAEDEDHEGEAPSAQATRGQPDWGWGAAVDMRKTAPTKAGEPIKYELEVLVMCEKEDRAQGKEKQELRHKPTTNGVQVETWACYGVLFVLLCFRDVEA